MLQVEGISKSFPGRREALRDLSFSVPAGEKAALLGLNGAGKTTAFRIILGLLAPDEGGVKVWGRRVGREDEEIQRSIGYLPENAPLYPELSPREHLDFLAAFHCIPDRKGRLCEMRECCGLGEVWNRPIGSLSKGFRQRVALASALIHEPRLLILDEPTVGLDPQQVDQFRALIRSISGGRAVILSTHILAEVEALCDRCLILHRGRLARDCRLPVSPGLRFRVQWQGAGPEAGDATVEDHRRLGDGWMEASLLLNDSEDAPRLLERMISRGARVRDFSRKGMSLEELFLRATTEGARKETQE